MSAKKFNPFSSEVEVLIVDENGKLTGETRTYMNSAFTYLFPNEPLILVNWGWEKPQGYRVDEETINRPIHFDGQVFHGNWAWGSAVKRMFTIGLVNDLVAGIGKKAEDGQRFGRYATPNALYGAGTGTLKVMAIPAGQTFNGLPVEDGFGYITREVADIVHNEQDKIYLKTARDSFHFWQRIPWTEAVEAEATPLIKTNLIDQADPTNWELEGASGLQEKVALVKIDPVMNKHMFVANAMSRSAQGRGVRLATTVPTHSITRLAVPTTDKSLNLNGPWVVTGYPIDAWGSIKAFNNKQADKAEMERIANLEVVQYSLSGHKVFAKGNLGIVDDLNGYDMIICEKDVKMGKLTAEALKDVYLGFTSYWGAGSCFGIETEVWKLMGRDYDGDTAQLTDCAKMPALWHAVKGLPEQETLKLDKSNLSLNKRTEMIVKSMTSIVGFATNVAADSFVYADREDLAERLGYRNQELVRLVKKVMLNGRPYKAQMGLDKQLNWAIKVGTDGFKTNVDMVKTEKQCAVLQSNILRMTGCSAPWTGWAKDGWSFKHGVPNWLRGDETKEEMKLPENANGIPADFDGTIAQILRLTLPSMQAFLKDNIESLPLSYFVNWVPNVPEILFESAKDVQVAFNTRVGKVNWGDPEEVSLFKKWWKTTLAKWMKKDMLTEDQAGAAMWRAAHSARSTYAGAASVFYGFPEYCAKIVATKPGLGEAKGGGGLKTILLGLNENVERAICGAKVVEVKELRGNVTLIRTAIELDDAKLMKGTQALIPVDQAQPAKGSYTAYITKRSDRSWFVTLTV